MQWLHLFPKFTLKAGEYGGVTGDKKNLPKSRWQAPVADWPPVSAAFTLSATRAIDTSDNSCDAR